VTKIFEMPNGVELEFADNTPDEEMFRQANVFVSQMAHQQDKRKNMSFLRQGPRSENVPGRPTGPRGSMSMEEREQLNTGNFGKAPAVGKVFRNLGAGALESIRNITDQLPNLNEIRHSAGGRSDPRLHLGPESRQDYQKMFGINDENRSEAIQKIPELASMVGAPNVGLGKFASNVSGRLAGPLARGVLNALGETLFQGSLGMGFNPESRTESGLEQAKYAAPASVIADMTMANNPGGRFLKRILPGSVGAYTGYNIQGEHVPMWQKLLGGMTGLVAGHQIGKGGRKIFGGGEEHFAQPYAERSLKNMTPGDLQNYNRSQSAQERLYEAEVPVDTTFGQKTQNPLHLAEEKLHGTTPENIKTKHAYQQNQQNQLYEAKQNTAEMQRPTEKDVTNQYKKAYKGASPQDIEKSVGQGLHKDEVYNTARKETYSNDAQVSKLKGAPEFSLQRQDQIKQNLDTRIKNMRDAKVLGGKNAPSEAEIQKVIDVKNNLTKRLDRVSKGGQYAKARRTYENKVFSDMVHSDTVEQFAARLKKPDSFDELIKSARGNPALQQRYRDLRLINGNIKKVDMQKMAEALGNKSVFGIITNPKKTAKEVLENFIDGDYTKASMHLSLNPDAHQEMRKLAQISDPSKRAAALVQITAKYLGHKSATDLNAGHKFTEEDYKKLEGA
jgi:hypothetical protein